MVSSGLKCAQHFILRNELRLRDLNGSSSRRRNAPPWRYYRRHPRRVRLNDDAASRWVNCGDGFDTLAPINVFQQQCREQEVGMSQKRCMLQIVRDDLEPKTAGEQ